MIIHKRLLDRLEEVAGRYRQLNGWLACSVVWLASAAVGVGLLELGLRTGGAPADSAVLLALAVGAVLLSGAACWLATRRTWNPRWVAQRIEKRHPELNCALLTAVEQTPEGEDGRFGYLQGRVFQDALSHSRRVPWEEDVSGGRILATQIAGLASFALLVVVVFGLLAQAAQARRLASIPPGLKPRMLGTEYRVDVSPGDAEIERGTSLVVTARFDEALPDDATLLIRDSSGETLSLPMSLSLSDPIFGARVPDVQRAMTYRVEYAGTATDEFDVEVFEYPDLTRADAELTFPEYTSLPDKRVEDTRRITAVEGTELTLHCDLNKPVASARLVDEGGGELELAARRDDPTVYSTTQTLEESQRYRLELVDGDGRSNKEPPQIVVNVTPNRQPELKIVQPARDVRVSPIEELQTKASLWDDYGLESYGVSYTLPGQSARDVTLSETSAGNERLPVEHLIAFEELEAEPDQLLAYYFWAEDVGPDSKPRRAMSDMYFAEVRHFEEIFRQGEQPPGGQSQQQQQQQGGQNARQAEELAEQQKQVINATWTVIRRETAAEASAEFSPDLEEIKTGQADAITKLGELAENLQDSQSLGHANVVKGHMLDVMTNLGKATEALKPALLPDALSSEQAAYQALLKLRAREHEVTRAQRSQQQQQSGSASGAQSRAQQQLEQLELDNNENRYETERQASPQQDQQQRETLQVLNRLRELARRQNDLNKRLKELQSALEEAKTEEEREDIRQQLKRLREQQQQLLRDMDELAERMERPENRERMSESREQLDETRENIRQTTEALREGQISQAVASGTRAQRQLEEMQEEFRNAASNRFAEDVEQLRDNARQLEQREQELAEQLEQLNRGERNTRSLRDSDNREQLRGEFDRQQENLEHLLENIRETVEEAEESEPLMAKQLYDSLRDAQQQRVDDALDATGQLLDRGLVNEARRAEEHAAQGIENLREGVEEAAESVLGNEEEALRRAQETLEELAEQLNEEIRRATGQPGEGEREESSPRAGQPPSQEDGPPQPQEGRQQGQPGNEQPQDSQAQQERSQQGQPQQRPSPNDRSQDQEPQEGQPSAGQQPDGQPGQGGRPGEQSRQEDGQRGQSLPPSPRPSSVEELLQNRPTVQGEPRQGGRQADGRRNTQREQAENMRQGPRGPESIDLFRGPRGPITGEFQPWSDRLRDVEEMIDDPELRGEVARVREAARDIRREMHRDFTGPNWDLVREFVSEPLNELRDRVAEELLRQDSDEKLVPIDRDPVPARFAEDVRRYYETLGSGQ